jgi:hypothetical protein
LIKTEEREFFRFILTAEDENFPFLF